MDEHCIKKQNKPSKMLNQHCEDSKIKKKTTKHKKTHLSNYNKKQILTLLKETNCHANQLDVMKSRFRLNDENSIKDFINTQAEISQARFEQSMLSTKNKHFLNLNQCAKNLHENGEASTDNTLPVTLEAISKLEEHPSPTELSGINLPDLYQMLANITAGYPVNELDGPTKQFLRQCFKELMDSVTETDAKTVRDMLIEQDKQTQPVYSWLCNSDYSQYLTILFKDMLNSNDDE